MRITKKLLSVALALVIMSGLVSLSPLSINAEENTSDILFYEVQDDGTACITGCDNSVDNLDIPSEIDGLEVTRIGADAFSGHSRLKDVSVPDGVVAIESDAFNGCTRLRSITLPDSLRNIGSGAFENTAYYNDYDNYVDNVLYIDNHLIAAFDGVPGEYTVEEDTVSIANNAFEDCEGLNKIELPESLENIGAHAFRNTGYSNNAANWDGSLLYLGQWLLESSANDNGVYNVKEGITTICEEALSGLENVKSVKLPESLEYIGKMAFAYSDMEAVELPEGVADIEDYAFFSCEKLKSIKIPDAVTHIEAGVFNCCSALEDITVGEGNACFSSLNGNLYNKTKSVLMQFPNGKTDKSFTVPGSVEKISEFAFSYNEDIEEIVLPEGLKTIGNSAFYECAGLLSIKIPDGVTRIGQMAFQGAESLSEISLPDTLRSIGEKAFDNTAYSNDKNNRDGGILCIDNYLISADKSVSGELSIKNGVTVIAEGAFRNCSELSSVVICDSVKFIGNVAFYGCTGIKSITIPANVEEIGNRAFGYYLNLEIGAAGRTEDLVINGYSDTAAERYADKNFFKFNSLDTGADAEGVIVVENGMAQQVVKYSNPNAKNYNNNSSEILRFAVHVETDYDTDLDGKPDLVKAFVQVPRKAVEGKYKAPVIFEANPYSAGMNDASFKSGDEQLRDSELKSKPAKRTPNGSATSLEAANTAKQSDWYYSFKSDRYDIDYYSNTTSYDYFLIRGFAFVTCAGLGSKGSEGLQVCGSEMERDAFKNVVEWLHGDRAAYTDLENNISIEADWSNRKVGMTGLSYVGAMAYEVATTGVDGLETVVPVAGPSSWYDFSNSQGICTNKSYRYNYTTDLSDVCASRFFDGDDETARKLYQNYRRYLEDSQIELKGDYGDYWAVRDYSEADGIKASALIVQGLNDDVVQPKQFDLMWKAFERSGQSPKAILHQNNHVTPVDADNGTDIKIGEYTYTEILNRWFCHYLLDVDNGVENMPAITAQSNEDGEFKSYDSWNTAASCIMKPEDNGTTTVSAKGAYEDNDSLVESVFVGKSSENAAYWKLDVTDAVTIKGAPEVNLRIKTDNIDTYNTSVAAVLVDKSDKEFNAFNTVYSSLQGEEIGSLSYGKGLKPYKLVKWSSEQVKQKIVAYGIMDLKNPEAGYMPSTAVKRATPVKSGEWYDYKLYLEPNLYKVQEGHRLELYIVPYINGSYSQDVTEIFPEEEILHRFGCTVEGICRHSHDYSFTIDNSKSYVSIPLDKAEAPITTLSAKADKSKLYVGESTTVKVSVNNPDGATTFTSSDSKIASVSPAGKVKALKAGTAVITAKNNGVAAKVKITVVKNKNTVTVKAKTKTVKVKKLKSKKQSVKPLTITKAQGKVKVTLVKSGTTKKIRAKVTVSKKGVITLKKGKYKKGTYKIKLKITVNGNAKYKPKTLNKTVKIKIK